MPANRYDLSEKGLIDLMKAEWGERDEVKKYIDCCEGY